MNSMNSKEQSAVDGRRLDSWKEIATYLGRSCRCAQRWEKNLRLPVHRIRHMAGNTVYAYVAELDAWRQSRDRLADLLEAPENRSAQTAEPTQVSAAQQSLGSTAMIGLCRLFLKAVPLRIARW